MAIGGRALQDPSARAHAPVHSVGDETGAGLTGDVTVDLRRPGADSPTLPAREVVGVGDRQHDRRAAPAGPDLGTHRPAAIPTPTRRPCRRHRRRAPAGPVGPGAVERPRPRRGGRRPGPRRHDHPRRQWVSGGLARGRGMVHCGRRATSTRCAWAPGPAKCSSQPTTAPPWSRRRPRSLSRTRGRRPRTRHGGRPSRRPCVVRDDDPGASATRTAPGPRRHRAGSCTRPGGVAVSRSRPGRQRPRTPARGTPCRRMLRPCQSSGQAAEVTTSPAPAATGMRTRPAAASSSATASDTSRSTSGERSVEGGAQGRAARGGFFCPRSISEM